MSRPPFRRTGSSVRDTAEAAFKSATTKPVEAPPKAPAIPSGREMVTLRIDREVLEHFQAGGPGWQDRINDVLRKIVDAKIVDTES
ncbi:BrnA antitoxin family protein [Xanthobacter autotrophicus]|uniref:BrnA antitoxin family protein n=1 Tax=Xanthobacter autotrophicus TaxID=280 RepID=UPI00372AB8B5